MPQVKSINTSGHKYGLVYPGVGWAIWREKHDLPEELIFNVNYLGGEMPTFALNFSRPGNQVVAQYYNFLRLGRDGYQRIHQACQEVAYYLSDALAATGVFEMLHSGGDLPVIAWKIKDTAKVGFDVFALSDRLRMSGWQVPAYTLPDNLSDVAIMRIVVKEGFSLELAELLVAEIKRVIDYFDQVVMTGKNQPTSGFHH